MATQKQLHDNRRIDVRGIAMMGELLQVGTGHGVHEIQQADALNRLGDNGHVHAGGRNKSTAGGKSKSMNRV